MLKNAYFLAKIGADTAEIEQHFAVVRHAAGARRQHRGASHAMAGTPGGVTYEQLTPEASPGASPYGSEMSAGSWARV